MPFGPRDLYILVSYNVPNSNQGVNWHHSLFQQTKGLIINKSPMVNVGLVLTVGPMVTGKPMGNVGHVVTIGPIIPFEPIVTVGFVLTIGPM